MKKCDAVRKWLEDFTGEAAAKKQQVVQMQQVRGEQKFAYHADSILSKDVKGILIFQSIQHVYTIVLPT